VPDQRSSLLTIRTPEGISFSILLAGPVSRMLALLIDMFCIAAAVNIISTVLRLLSLVSTDISIALIIFANFIISIGYGIACEWFWRGQTLGKRLLRLRVVDEQGLKLQPSQVVIRNLLRVVDSFPLFYLTGGITTLLGGKCQRLGDLAAGTIVVRHLDVTLPNLFERMGEDKFNSLRDYPHLFARLRQKISRDDCSIAIRALMRRDSLEPEARLKLFNEIAERFKSLVKFPQEAVDGLTDERFVRNVIDLIFNYRNR
jgi:uncharacterized RDD family membrane protein YckC